MAGWPARSSACSRCATLLFASVPTRAPFDRCSIRVSWLQRATATGRAFACPSSTSMKSCSSKLILAIRMYEMPRLAINGGNKTYDGPWPAWPVWGDAEREALSGVLESGKWWYGQRVNDFEQEFARFQDARFG